MKPTHFVATAAGCALLLVIAGCSESESPGTEPATNSLSATATELGETTRSAVGEIRNTAEQATAEVGRQAEAVTNQAQKFIDQARSLIAERKYTEAWDAVTKASGFQLTAEQRKVVDDLKAQLERLMANPGVSNALDAARGLLR